MDKDIFYISMFLIFVGVAGQLAWYYYGGIACPVSGGQPYLFSTPCNPNATAASFQEMQNVSGLMMIVGFILLPAGLFKDGLPIPGMGAKVFLGVVLIILAGLTLTAVVSLPQASTPPLTPQSFITILPGSGVGPNSTSVPGVTFYPKVLTVVLGVNSTVEWLNNDTTLHSATSLTGPASFSSNANQLGPNGGIYVFDFGTAGTYTYHCIYHSWMAGEVIVKP